MSEKENKYNFFKFLLLNFEEEFTDVLNFIHPTGNIDYSVFDFIVDNYLFSDDETINADYRLNSEYIKLKLKVTLNYIYRLYSIIANKKPEKFVLKMNIKATTELIKYIIKSVINYGFIFDYEMKTNGDKLKTMNFRILMLEDKERLFEPILNKSDISEKPIIIYGNIKVKIPAENWYDFTIMCENNQITKSIRLKEHIHKKIELLTFMDYKLLVQIMQNALKEVLSKYKPECSLCNPTIADINRKKTGKANNNICIHCEDLCEKMAKFGVKNSKTKVLNRILREFKAGDIEGTIKKRYEKLKKDCKKYEKTLPLNNSLQSDLKLAEFLIERNFH